jgi:excisionase family DNA binding protein
MEYLNMIDFTVNEGIPQETKMPDLEEFMTTQEASEKLDLTIRAVNRLVVNKKLEGIRVGRMHLISRVSVKSYLDKTRDMSKNDPRRKVLKK